VQRNLIERQPGMIENLLNHRQQPAPDASNSTLFTGSYIIQIEGTPIPAAAVVEEYPHA